MNLGSVHGSVHGFVYGFVYGLVYVLDNVPIEHGGLHCVLPCAVLLRSTWGFYLNHLIPLRPIKSVFDNVLFEHGGLHHVLTLAVHLFFYLNR